MKLSCIMGPAAAATLALLASLPAAAQSLGTGIPLNQEEAKSPEELEKLRKIDEAYRATMKTIPNAKQQNDPWGNVRSADTKPAQVKPKSAPKTNAAN